MIYFDHAATTPVSTEVFDLYTDILKNNYANPSSFHSYGLKASTLVAKARAQVGKYFHAHENEVIFTSGASESNNLAIKGVLARYKNRGNKIITSKFEHPSVLNIFKNLENNYDVVYIGVNSEGEFDFDALKNAVDNKTVLISMMAVNNETGLIFPCEKVSDLKRSFPNLIFHCDATQAIGKIDINFDDVDLISFSAHKINGLKGSGGLIKRERIDILPLIEGGGQEFNFRSGTTNVPSVIALAKTVRLAFEERNKHFSEVKVMFDELYQFIEKIDGMTMISKKNGSPFILNFALTNYKASVVVEALSKEDIMVSTKSACSSKKNSLSYVIKALGYSEALAANSIRISLSHLNTFEEVEVFKKTLINVLQDVRKK